MRIMVIILNLARGPLGSTRNQTHRMVRASLGFAEHKPDDDAT